jgi:threonine synthase
MVNRCARCGGSIRIRYDYALISSALNKESLRRRPHSLWRYRELLPIADESNIVSLGEGGTPLISSRRIGPSLGMRGLCFKDETRLPTGSLKDRCASVTISKAVESEVQSVVVSSSGNGAAAMSAYSARGGINCYVFVPSSAAENKLLQCASYGARVIKVNGIAGTSNEMAGKVAARNRWPNVSTAATYNPYSLEGQKTVAYEIAEQTNWNTPDWLVIPVGSGNNLAGEWAGFTDLTELGFIGKKPRIAAVQAEGCAPFADAVRRNLSTSEVKSWENPDTVAAGVRDEFPYDLEFALPALRESRGCAVTVSDREIVDAERSLARDEGIYVEPTGAVATAGLKNLIDDKLIDRDESVVVMLTGSGLKDPSAMAKELPQPLVVDPDLEKILQLL